MHLKSVRSQYDGPLRLNLDDKMNLFLALAQEE